MVPLYNIFKRHYRKTRPIFNSMAETGSLEFKGKFDREKGSSAQVLTPDVDLTLRFVILMRRFLNPSDPLHFRIIWSLMLNEFESEIPPGSKSSYENLSKSLIDGSAFAYQYNDKELSTEQIYQLIAEGGYFNHEKQARDFLTSTSQIPIAGQFLLFQFYDYTFKGYYITSLIFDVLLIIEKTTRYKEIYGDPTTTINHCIFCQLTTGKFFNEEHIIPESLGNVDWLLPKGYVCDPCNNGVLALLDNYLSNFPMFTIPKVQNVSYDKEGRLPKARMGRITFEKKGPLEIHLKSDSDSIKFFEDPETRKVRFRFREKWQYKFDEKLLARALCKIGLELIASDIGHEFACSERYNRVRGFIISGGDFNNNLLFRTKHTHEGKIQVLFLPSEEGTGVEINLYGVTFLLNLEENPKLELNSTLQEAGFISFPLFGESSWESFRTELISDLAESAQPASLPKLAESEEYIEPPGVSDTRE